MKTLYITNAFSLNMLSLEDEGAQSLFVQHTRTPRHWLQLTETWGFTRVPAIGHTDLAAVASAELGIPLPPNRATITAQPGDLILVAQYRGPRLPEGTTALPTNATIEWYLVEIRGE